MASRGTLRQITANSGNTVVDIVVGDVLETYFNGEIMFINRASRSYNEREKRCQTTMKCEADRQR